MSVMPSSRGGRCAPGSGGRSRSGWRSCLASRSYRVRSSSPTACKATFDNLFTQLTAERRPRGAVGRSTVDDISAVRDPMPASLATTVAAVAGRRHRRRRAAAHGDVAREGRRRDRDARCTRARRVVDRGPRAQRRDVEGRRAAGGAGRGRDRQAHRRQQRLRGRRRDQDRVRQSGPATFRIVGLVGLGNTDGFGGATIAIVRPRARAADPRTPATQWDVDRHPHRAGRRHRHRQGRGRGGAAAAHRGRHRRAGQPRRRPTRSTRSSRSSAPGC